MGRHYSDGPYDGEESNQPAEKAQEKPKDPATITPVYNRAPQTPGQELMFVDHVFRPRGARHVYIALHAPMKQDIEEMRPHARTILDRMFKDTGKPQLDLMNAFVKAMYRFVPEYAAAAAPVNEHGKPERMPQVIISLDDGQHIGIGRPDSQGGVLPSANDYDSALTWSYLTRKPPFGVTAEGNLHEYRYRQLDREYVGQLDPGFETDARRPIDDLFATILAATEASRMKIFESVYDKDRASLPLGPLTVDDPRESEKVHPRKQSRIPTLRPA